MERLHGKAWREQLSAGMQTSLEKIRRAGAKINIEADGISKNYRLQPVFPRRIRKIRQTFQKEYSCQL